MSRLLGLSAAAAWLAAGCVAAQPPPSICGLAANELVIFPDDGQRFVPTNATIRVLAGGGAGDLRIALIHLASDTLEPGNEVLLSTSFGEVLELTPDFILEASTSYRIEIVERGALVAASTFTTDSFDERGSATGDGDVFVEPILARDRACCSSDGCRDGTLIEAPALGDGAFNPQLVLLSVDEHYNDECGPQVDNIGVVPVVVDDPRVTLLAETDLLLDGCFSIEVISQTLLTSQPGGITCTPGRVWQPGPVTSECQRGGGCSCEASPTPGRALFVVVAAVLVLWRRRRVRRRIA